MDAVQRRTPPLERFSSGACGIQIKQSTIRNWGTPRLWKRASLSQGTAKGADGGKEMRKILHQL